MSKKMRAYVAVGLAAWLLVGPVFAKPLQLLRNPALEGLAVIGLVPHYRVYYKNCERGPGAQKWKFKLTYRMLFAGADNVFPSLSDEGAMKFASRAFPECDISSVYRYRRHPLGANYRYNRNSRVLIYPK